MIFPPTARSDVTRLTEWWSVVSYSLRSGHLESLRVCARSIRCKCLHAYCQLMATVWSILAAYTYILLATVISLLLSVRRVTLYWAHLKCDVLTTLNLERQVPFSPTQRIFLPSTCSRSDRMGAWNRWTESEMIRLISPFVCGWDLDSPRCQFLSLTDLSCLAKHSTSSYSSIGCILGLLGRPT